VGVHPTAILLSRLALESSRRGLKGILDRAERVWGWDADVDLLGEPYWFQDKVDGRCLSPYGGGFGECGDATLWRVRRRPLTKRQARERRYRVHHRKRLESREKEETQGSHSQQQQQQQQNEKSMQPKSDPSVCVWPFFCEQDSKFLQTTQYGTDEIYGYEYDNRDEEEEGFALQLMDMDAMTANSSFSSYRASGGLKDGSSRRSKKRLLFWNSNSYQGVEDEDAECLLPSLSDTGESTFQIGSCSSEAAWVWHVNRDGILVRGFTKSEKKKRKRSRLNIFSRRASAAASAGSGNNGRLTDFECVHRADSTSAMLRPCDNGGDGTKHGKADNSLVGFSLVRYPSTATKSVPRGENDAEPMWEPWTTLEGPSIAEVTETTASDAKDKETASSPEQHLPKSHTSSGNHASEGAQHPHHVDLKSTSSMLHTSLEPGRHGKAKADAAATSASHIRDAPVAMNGVSFHNQRMNKAGGGGDQGPSKRPSSTKLKLNKSKNKNARAKGQVLIHEEKEDPSEARANDHHHHGHADSNPHRPRKIPVHPYIQSSKDFVWVDPLTSLEYPTDLCRYLGHTKKEAGRHTLMGVGQYYRTAFNIKVYGAALYVAKRDVLADPKFGEYATLSSDELRNRGDFYEHLMNMPSSEDGGEDSVGGFFDRTLFIKINMQLSTNAMRQSLEADWSLLTEEMKTLIIDASFEEREADERMQKKIQSKENSSNCSCGQVASPELKADPTCCARGTELVFTWRKNGDFEIRLDGRVMATFPRPDMARGIFGEYLNDTPISVDAKAHFADGFPFLLAPLAQVKGMSSAVPNTQTHEGSTINKLKDSPSSQNPMHRMMDAAAQGVGAVNSQAQTLSKWMANGAASASSSALGGAMGVARGLSDELDRQRMEFLDGAVALQKEGMEMLSHLIKQSTEEDGLGALAVVANPSSMPSAAPFSNGYGISYDDVVIPDEIGINIEPTMNFTHRLFFTTVHIYLLLLLVLSMPGSTTRFVVVKRRILETKKFVEVKSQGAFAAMSKLHH